MVEVVTQELEHYKKHCLRNEHCETDACHYYELKLILQRLHEQHYEKYEHCQDVQHVKAHEDA